MECALGAKGSGTTALGSTSREAVPLPVDSGFGVELPLAPSVTTIIAPRVPAEREEKCAVRDADKGITGDGVT